MKLTKELPRDGEWRERKVFAWFPMWFKHYADGGAPLRTMVWLEYYIVEECYQWGGWSLRDRKMI